MTSFTYAGLNDRVSIQGHDFPNGHAIPVSDAAMIEEIRARSDFAETPDEPKAKPAKKAAKNS